MFTARKKSLDSLSEKLESGRYPKWSDVDDLFACAIVVPTSSHEELVVQYLDAVFDRVELRSRNSTQKAPDSFRFDSTRYIGRMKQEVGLTLVPGVREIAFEVQIPTIFEHAWGVVTHDLVYKSNEVDWRKARLASQLHATVEQIELVIAGFEANAASVPQSPHPETEAKALIVESFHRFVDEGLISKELIPQSWGRFADNVYGVVASSSNRYEVPNRVSILLSKTEAYLRTNSDASDLKSGSLFQLAIAMINRGAVPGVKLDRFVIVDSPELSEFHDVHNVPKAFVFD